MSDQAECEIRQHGKAVYPDECCGALLGQAEDTGKTVTAVIPLPNARQESRENRFLVEDLDYVRVEREADQRGLKLLGFYHSHPDHPAEPSRFDLDHAFPWFSYVIVAVHNAIPEAMTCWVLSEERDRFIEERIVRGWQAFEAMEGA